jgi:hypothetical protein
MNVLLQVSPQVKIASELDPATDEAMQSALDVLATFLGMLCSATAIGAPLC